MATNKSKTSNTSSSSGKTNSSSSGKTNSSSSGKTNSSSSNSSSNKITTNNGKQYTVGQTVKGSSTGKEYTVQANGTFTSGGKTYSMGSDGKLREQKSTSSSGSTTAGNSSNTNRNSSSNSSSNSSNNKITTSNGKQYTVGQTIKGSTTGKEYTVQADGTFTSGGKTYSMGSDGKLREQKSNSSSSSTTGNTASNTTSANFSADIKALQDLGATNASDAYKKAIDAGYSQSEASKLASTYGRLNAAASASAETQYQYGATQSDINQFNIMQANNVSTNYISTGTYTFNTKTYNNVQSELQTSSNATTRIMENIDRAMQNTSKDSEEYQQLSNMYDKMGDVHQSTNFIRNRLEDAYNATKAADDAVQRIVMSVSTDNLKITVGKQVGYDLSNSVNTRENDAAKWNNYVSKGIVGNGGKNNSTVSSLNEVNNLQGANANSVGDIFTAYDVKNNLNSCTSNKDYILYARNNEDGLKQVAETFKNDGRSEEQWKNFLDKYYVTDANGNKKESTVTQEVYDSYVNYFNGLQNETGTVDVKDYAAASNDTNYELGTTMNSNVNNFTTDDGNISVKVQGTTLNVTTGNTQYQVVSDAEYAANKDKYKGQPVITESQFDKMVSIMVHEQSNKSDEYLALATVFANNMETDLNNIKGSNGYYSCNYDADAWFRSACEPYDQNGKLYTSATKDANGNYTGQSADAANALMDVLNGKRVFNDNVLYWRGNGTDNTFGTHWEGAGSWSTAGI